MCKMYKAECMQEEKKKKIKFSSRNLSTGKRAGNEMKATYTRSYPHCPQEKKGKKQHPICFRCRTDVL